MAVAPGIIINLPPLPINRLDSVSSITALRAISSMSLSNGQDIVVDGSVYVGDGGGNVFTWSELSNAVDDGVTVVKPNDLTPLLSGRWIVAGKSVIDGLRATATQLAPGLMSVSDKIKSDGIVDFKADFGGVYDGLTNQSAKLNDAALALKDGRKGDRGGRIDIGHYGKLMLGDGANIPRNIQIVGQFDPQKAREGWNFLDTTPSVLIIPPGKSILMDGGKIQNVLLWQSNITQNPADPTAFYIELVKFSGDAIVATGDDPFVVGCMAIGFEWMARFNNVFNPTAVGNIFDCNNGIEVTACYEFGPYGISHNQGRGVYIQYKPWPWEVTRRPGTAFYIHDGIDFIKCEGNDAYGYGVGLHLKNASSVTLLNNKIDGPAIHTPESAAACVGTRGIWLEGNISNSKLIGSHVDGYDFGYVFDTDGNPLIASANTAGYCMSNHLSLGASSCGDLGVMKMSGGGPYDPGAGIDRRVGTPITVNSGVGRWSGRTIATGDSKTGNYMFLQTPSDINKLRNLKRDQINGTFADPYGYVWESTVSGLSSYPNPKQGDVAIVTDSTMTYSAGLGNSVVGGGANSVPVLRFNGSWIIG